MAVHAVKPGSDLEKMAYFDEDSGTLYVSKTHAFDPNVRSYTSLLRNEGINLNIQNVAMEVIQTLRTNQVRETRTDVIEASEMQRTASELFKMAFKRRASDIHIRVSSKGDTRILFRIHNDLEQIAEHPYSWGKLLCSAIYTAMSDISAATYEENARQDGRISAKKNLVPGLDGIRIATTPQVDGTVMVLRLLYNDADKSTDICSLGYDQAQKEEFALMKRRPTGINIIAGPTGSGKSTTLQRTLLSIHQECRGTKHIITVEDPPEYPMPGIVQTPVADATTEAERSAAFQAAIKATMRLDPNVIMIGEMRDTPSVRLAIQAAMTGHQVWSTVHANSAFAVIDRMVDLGIPLNMMADPSIVTGLICQRLLKVLCPHCKKPFAEHAGRYSAGDRDRIMSSIDVETAHVIGDGCDRCQNTGIAGRTVVAEIVVPDQVLMAHVRKGDRDKAIAYWRESGGRSMLDLAIVKINAGLVDPFQAEDEVGPLNFVLQDASPGSAT
ncbi:GspE/PulE family protein [Polaromonas sp.]|uniref:GspE/PulE family protein n=1 Tax=Polaromonas sp. TaxID=1869339 RepID=UPI00352B6970